MNACWGSWIYELLQRCRGFLNRLVIQESTGKGSTSFVKRKKFCPPIRVLLTPHISSSTSTLSYSTFRVPTVSRSPHPSQSWKPKKSLSKKLIFYHARTPVYLISLPQL